MIFTYSRTHYNKKPQEKSELGYLQSFPNYRMVEMDIPEIAAKIDSGHAWRAGVYSEEPGKFAKKYALGSHIIALDFDKVAFEPSEICTYAASIGIPVNIWYYSYSQGIKEGNNFRIMWCFEKIIKPDVYEGLYKALLDAFGAYNPDPATKDISRLWFGSWHNVHIEKAEYTSLGQVGWLKIMESVHTNGNTAKVKNKADKSIQELFNIPEPEKARINPRNLDWCDALAKVCPLWKAWMDGEYLDYNQRLTLFTNMKYLELTTHNEKLYSSITGIAYHFYNAETYAGHTCDYDQISSMFRMSTLRPLPIVKVGSRYLTIPDWFNNKGVPTDKKVELEELEELMRDKIPQVFESKGMQYIKCQTGSGKTQFFIDWVLKQDLLEKKIIYSVPTNNNIKEFYDRMLKANSGVKPFNVYPMPTTSFTEEDKHYLRLGFPALTRNAQRASMISQMLSDAPGLYICSHSLLVKLVNDNFTADLIVIDENIEETLIQEIDYQYVELSALHGYVPKSFREQFDNWLDLINEQEEGTVISLDILKKTLEEMDLNRYIQDTFKNRSLKGLTGLGNVVNYEDAVILETYNGKELYKQKKALFIGSCRKNNIPVKFMCATPKQSLLDIMAEEHIEAINFPVAKNKGKILCCYDVSGAKSVGIEDTYKKVIEKLPPSVISDAYLLTFKDWEEEWANKGFIIPEYNDTKIHIANNAGLDMMKGKNLIVVGKYDYNQLWYKKIYYGLLGKTGPLPNLCMQTVNIKGVAQKICLYNDQELAAIQLENITWATEQAAGRARALREQGATVYVFSNLPIEDADGVL